MTEWQKKFTSKIDNLRESAAKRFEKFASNVLEEVHEEVVDFATQHEFVCTAPGAQSGSRTYKFGLTEDGFVLVYFRSQGIADVEFSFECFAPGRGQVVTRQQTCGLGEADADWVERCLQSALDEFVDVFSKSDVPVAEPVLV